ncbi:MAG TPA: hypothetical protein VJX23_12420 [Candidatus Binataceae bacterium]|nr:hypothetical protein [Candidatus Binataceae bacterium]
MEHVKQETLGQINTVELTAQTGEGVRFAQSRFLDELPGAAFAGITLLWIVSSLAGLMWREMPAGTIAHIQSLAQVSLGWHSLRIVSRLAGAAGFAKTAYRFFAPRTPA